MKENTRKEEAKGNMMYIKLVIENQEDRKENEVGKYIQEQGKQQDS